jgi:hypothetical protein
MKVLISIISAIDTACSILAFVMLLAYQWRGRRETRNLVIIIFVLACILFIFIDFQGEK